jgi:ABC-type branched-subunit amino acid transport system permease subunit
LSTSSLSAGLLKPANDTRALLVKWLVALLVPVLVFTFAWAGESLINNALLVIFGSTGLIPDTGTAIQVAVFILLFYATVIALAGYLVAADSGRRGVLDLWLSVFIFVMVPLLMLIVIGNLIIGLAASVIIWGIYFLIRRVVRRMTHYTAPAPIDALKTNTVQPAELMLRAKSGGFWFATLFAVIWLVVDLIFFFSGSLPTLLLIWVIVRTLALPVAGYFLGQLGGTLALRRTLAASAQANGNGSDEVTDGSGSTKVRVSKRRQLRALSASRANEEAKDLVPNDLPFRSKGAQRFYIILLAAFVLFYPAIDPLLFGYGSAGRLSGYGDAGYYVILALGLNIVVGFAGLLDLGYVAFFAIGSYAWGMVGSTQFQYLTGIIVNPQVWPWFFWPMLLGAAVIAAFWGVILGAPTLRLRGDYLAIVTLGFGEIVPIIFLELDKYTNGTNGIVGVYSPKFPGVSNWSSFTPIPYYYLILVLIGVLIFVNIRLRDSRLGRAWIAIREDEIAAASSGINLSRTKLFAFGSGAFFAGIAGAYHAAKLGGVTPDDFNYSDSIIYLAMVVIGGLGSIPGVIVGALVVYSINLFLLTQLDTLAGDPNSPLHIVTQLFPNFTFDSIRNLIFGSILVIVMIFRPEGLIPSARRRRELHHVEADGPEEGSLDVPPGAPGFESEIRVD